MENTDFFEVAEDVLELVVKSLNYSSIDSFNEDAKKIEEWMERQPHFPEIMAVKKIKNFLILNKGSVERSKEKIENYYNMRTRLPEIFENINPKLPYMEYLKAAIYLIPLPKLTKEMYRVLFYKIRDSKLTENFDPIYGIRLLVNMQEIRMIEDVTYGEVFIFDGKNTPLSSFLNLTPMIVYKALVLIYKQVFSNRLKAVYVINAPSYVEKVLILLKNVLKPKLFNRIHFVENEKVLVEQIGEDILPIDCGGKEKSFEKLQEMLHQQFKEREDYFDRLDQLRINMELKPQRLRNDELFGFPGNFKKLEID